ncbi:MAG: hypothetical protein F4213_16040 [Boseongicola sp. SB0677_bin_26]|nr:hypothetical protein [Boseongicola sp. SB0677_bin_26]
MRSADEMQKRVVDRSVADPDFRQQLPSDPRSAISDDRPGITFPNSMTIEVHERDMQTLRPALPPDPNGSEERLYAGYVGPCCLRQRRVPMTRRECRNRSTSGRSSGISGLP